MKLLVSERLRDVPTVTEQVGRPEFRCIFIRL